MRLKHIYNPESLYFFKKKILKKVFKIKNSFLKQNKKQLQESFGIKKLIKYLILNLANKINLNLKK